MPSARTVRWVGGAIAIGIVAIVVWRVRSSTSAARVEPGATTPSTSTTGDASAIEAHAPDAVAARDPDRAREVAEVVDAGISSDQLPAMRLGFDDAHARLRDLVAPCFAKAPIPVGKRLVFRYRLVVVDKHTEISSPEVVEADFELGSARLCVVTAMDNAEWASELPDLDTPIEDQFVASEL